MSLIETLAPQKELPFKVILTNGDDAFINPHCEPEYDHHTKVLRFFKDGKFYAAFPNVLGWYRCDETLKNILEH